MARRGGAAIAVLLALYVLGTHPVRSLDDALDLTSDDVGPAVVNAATNGGRGTIGMRERAVLAGGEFRAGRRAAGGYGVHARLRLRGGER